MTDENNNNSKTINGNNNNNQPSLIHISEILQHSIELKLCSSIQTHNVFWDTLFHGIETNPEAMSMILSLLLTKYIQLHNNEKSNNSLIQSLFSKITNSNIILSHDEITNVLSGKPLKEDTMDDDIIDDNDNNILSNSDYSSSTINNSSNYNSTPPLPISMSSPLLSTSISNSNSPSSLPSTPKQQMSFPNLSNLDSLLLDDLKELNGVTSKDTTNYNNSNLNEQPIIQQDINSEEYKENEISKSSILSTVTFLSLNYTFNSNYPTLKIMLAKFNEIIDKSKPDSVIQTELSRILSPGFKDSNEFIFFLLDQSADLLQVIESTKQLRNSWFNAFVRDLLKNPSKSKMVFDNLFLFLKHPLLTEKRMLIFIQMLKHYLLVSPIISPSTINSALSIVKTYYLWPKPYCDFAKELLEILTIEEKCPGSYYRSILALELPSISNISHQSINTVTTNTNSSTIGNLSSTNQKTRPIIHMLIDRYNSEALIIQELFEINSKLIQPNTTQYQINNIANIYFRIMGIDNSSLGLEYLEASDIAQYHFKILDVMNKTIYFEESESKTIRQRELSNLREEIIKTISNYKEPTPKSYYPQQITLPNLNYQFHSLNRISIRNKKPDEFGSPYQIPLYKKTMTTLLALFSSYQDQDFHSTCKLPIVGNDSSIQHVLGTYVFLKYQSTYLFDDIDVHFYIIPAGGQCKFFEYISSFDPWYHRQSCLAIRSLFNIVPTFPLNIINSNNNGAQSQQIQSSDQSFLESISQIPLISEENNSNSNPEDIFRPPSYVIQSEIEYLFREASFKLDLPVMKCEAWIDDLYYTVPFLMKAELNLNSYLATQTEGLNLDPIQLSKLSSKFQSFNVNTKFLQINQSELSVIESKSFSEIVIHNSLPKSININTDSNNSNSTINSTINSSNNSTFSDPLYKPKMELVLASEEKKKKIDRFNFNIESVEIELSDKKKFDILLDSQLHGPFNKVKISYCTLKPTLDKNNKLEHHYITFPVMTYLPNYQ